MEIALTPNDVRTCKQALKGFGHRTDGHPTESEILCLSFGYAELTNDGALTAFGKIIHIFELNQEILEDLEIQCCRFL